MTSRRLVSTGVAAVVLAGAAGAGLALAGADTPARGPLVLLFLAVAPAVAIAGLLRNLDPFARLVIAVTGAIAVDYLVAEVMLAAGAWSPAGGLVAVLVIVAACFAVQIPVVRGRLHASLKASQALAGRLAAASAAAVRLPGHTGAGGSAAQPAAGPSLWLELRGKQLRALGPGRAVRGRWIRPAIVVAVVLLAAAAGVMLPRDRAGQPTPRRTLVPSTQAAGAQAVRAQAAGWILAQVSRATIVSCDPVMCAELRGRGFPASNLDVLRPGTSDPLDSAVTVATGVLRSQFGGRLTSVYAPLVLASFGSGSASIQVRAVAPDGGAAYLRQLSADVAARRSFGGQLAHNPRVVTGPTARRQLERGRVDARLIVVIGTMAQAHRLHVLSFGDGAPGAAPWAPLRSALLGVAAGRSPSVPALQTLRSFLDAQKPPYVPAVAKITRLPAGQYALKVRFAVPDPLGLLGTGRTGATIPSRS